MAVSTPGQPTARGGCIGLGDSGTHARRSTDEADHARPDPQRRPHLPRWRRQDEPRRGDALRRRRDPATGHRRGRDHDARLGPGRAPAQRRSINLADRLRSSTTARGSRSSTPRATPTSRPMSSRRSPPWMRPSSSSMPPPASRSAPRRSGASPRQRGLPRMIFINKMDRENANYDATLDALKARFGAKIAPVYLPDRLRRLVPRLRGRHRGARQRLRGRQAEGGADPAGAGGHRAHPARRARRGGRRGERRADG